MGRETSKQHEAQVLCLSGPCLSLNCGSASFRPGVPSEGLLPSSGLLLQLVVFPGRQPLPTEIFEGNFTLNFHKNNSSQGIFLCRPQWVTVVTTCVNTACVLSKPCCSQLVPALKRTANGVFRAGSTQLRRCCSTLRVVKGIPLQPVSRKCWRLSPPHTHKIPYYRRKKNPQ